MRWYHRAGVALAGLVLVGALGSSVAAQAPSREIARIGVLRTGSPPDPFVEAFRVGLRERGYSEGQNVALEYRWAKGREQDLAALAADLVGAKVAVIVTSGAPAILAAKGATSDTPIVMAAVGDPVRAKLIASYARPGGNVTGLAYQIDELPGKWVQLFKEAVPRATRVIALADRAEGGVQVKAAEDAARSLGLRLDVVKVESPADFDATFVRAKKAQADGLIVLGSPFFSAHRARLVELAARHRLPTMYHQQEFVVGAGGLMSYGPDFREMFRRAATYVDKILKGARTQDLPVERPSKFELVINLRAARAIGLTVPAPLLQRADQVLD